MYRAIAGLWRWRRNPLRRRSDRGESWIAVCTLLAIVLGSPVAGSTAGEAAHRTLQAKSRVQQEQRQQVWATVLKALPRHGPGQQADRVEKLGYQKRVLASWLAPDGTPRKSVLDVAQEVHHGDRMRLWTDERGSLSSAPMTRGAATSYAALAGLVVSVVFAMLLELVRRLVLHLLLLRRYREWEREWARVGPGWGRSWPAASG